MVASYSKAIELDPKFAPAYNGLAWLWATSPKESYRDGAKALAYARKAVTLTKWKEATYIDTLAAASAAAGRFMEAVRWQRKALTFPDFVKSDGEQARARMKLYKAHQPYRQQETQ